MVQNLEGMGFTVVPFGQGVQGHVSSNKGADITYTWWSPGTELDNIFICSDLAGNIKHDKEKSMEKIDGAVSTVMALDRAIRCGAGL